jgi:tRNA (guanine-N7-)-methyltransferase
MSTKPQYQNPPTGFNTRKRIRAHANPLSDELIAPDNPDQFNWSALYPSYSNQIANNNLRVTIADVGCGFAGLLVALSPLFPNELILGLEIRDRVVDIDLERINKLRAEAKNNCSNQGNYENISVARTNIMKYAPNYFHKGQLKKMFILFADPHFKRSNHRRRVINNNFLAIYAYCLEIGGLLYTITDVEELHVWMVKHLDEHSLFERVEIEKELSDDPCIDAMTNKTEEGQKVTREGRNKYPAVYRRIADPHDQ